MKTKEIIKEAVSVVLYIAVVLAATWFVITFVGQRTQVNGSSMEPTLSDHDNLIVDKISYRFRDPKRYDIIVFPYKYEENTYYIKRIIGLPGETVQIIDGEVYINGEPLEAEGALDAASIAGLAEYPMELSEDEYFLLGDNRESSEDSRFSSIGNVKRDQLIGKVWFRIQPFSQFGPVSLKGEEG